MSLLSDEDFVLRVFRLNYLKHVLPSHAHPAQPPGTGPYNLITFTPSTSPYIQLAGLDNEAKWPQLATGRHSPPLACAPNRKEPKSTLDYSKTIGKTGGLVDQSRLGRRRRTSLTIDTPSSLVQDPIRIQLVNRCLPGHSL